MLSLSIPIYEQADLKLAEECILGFLAQHPLLGPMFASSRVSEHHGPVRNVRQPHVVDQMIEPIVGTLTISLDTIRNTDIDSYVVALHDLAQEHTKALSGEFFRTLSEITEATGNVIDAQGKPFSMDQFLDALEKVELGFDTEGRPLLPTIVMHPDNPAARKGGEFTEEQRQRFADIIARKKLEYDDKKRTQRLS